MIEKARKIIAKYPDLVNSNATHETADPYVIALAYLYKHEKINKTPIIVTAENANSIKKIPYMPNNTIYNPVN